MLPEVRTEFLFPEGRAVIDWRGPCEDICGAAYRGMFGLWKFTKQDINDMAIFLYVYYVQK